MSLVESLHRKRELFRADIAARAVPDAGIDLSRKTIPIAHVEVVQEVPVAHFPWNPEATIENLEDAIRELTDKVMKLREEADRRRVKTPATILEIQRFVARHYGLKPRQLVSAARTADVVLPRQIAMFMSRQITRKSFPFIGRIFGGRDHTTVLHALRKIELLRINNEGVKAEIDNLIVEFCKVSSFVASVSQPENADADQPGS